MEEPHFEHCLLLLFKNNWLDHQSLHNLFKCHPLYAKLESTINDCRHVIFSPLRQYRRNWNKQKNIPMSRVKMCTAYLIHFNGHIGDAIRYVGGNYTTQYRDIQKALHAVEPLLSKEDLLDLKRCYEVGSPNKLVAEVSRKKSMLYLKRGNHQNISQNPDLAQKIMNKEEKKISCLSFVFMVDEILTTCSSCAPGSRD